MAKKDSETFCIIDHANKLADRERANPNRRKLRLLRALGSVPDDATDVDRGARKVPGESE